MSATRLEVGRIVKAHGIKGEVLVALTTTRTDRVAPGAVLHTDKGPLTVIRSSAHQGKWIVAFEGIPDRNTAETMRGTVLSADHEPDAADDTLWIHELIGAEVVDVSGASLGEVVAVQANPASDLIVLDGGALIPLRFVVDKQPGRVTVDPPAGLFDLE